MIKFNSLLKRISDEYDILKGRKESENQWKMRLIYSAIGRAGLAALYDISEEGNSSIVHMKKRIEILLASYQSMYPELERLLPVLPEELSNEVYDIYIQAGVVYHKPNRIIMATKSMTTQAGVGFTRGYPLEEKQSISGLGTYTLSGFREGYSSLFEMFQLDELTLEARWKACISQAQFSGFQSELNTEYLRVRAPFSHGHWVNQPDQSGEISILRTGFKGSQLYYLYKVDGDNLLASQLPQWQVEGYHYRSLANACLKTKGVLPPSVYKYDGDIVNIRFGYLPPPPDLALWKLYTWPTTMTSFPRDFTRVCIGNVFNSIKGVMEQQGYEFVEE